MPAYNIREAKEGTMELDLSMLVYALIAIILAIRFTGNCSSCQ